MSDKRMQLGMGVMINLLKGNEHTVEVFHKSVGKTISSIELKNNVLFFTFDDGYRIQVWDNGQSCCELRYMRTDDDLSYFAVSKLLNMEIRDAPDVEEKYGVHEVQFLLVTTSKGVFTMNTHNEHNGYYGGFSIEIDEVKE